MKTTEEVIVNKIDRYNTTVDLIVEVIKQMPHLYNLSNIQIKEYILSNKDLHIDKLITEYLNTLNKYQNKPIEAF